MTPSLPSTGGSVFCLVDSFAEDRALLLLNELVEVIVPSLSSPIDFCEEDFAIKLRGSFNAEEMPDKLGEMGSVFFEEPTVEEDPLDRGIKESVEQSSNEVSEGVLG